MKSYYLYILFSEKLSRYYIGISYDPELRLHFHNTSHKGWTRRGRPWHLVFKKDFSDRKEAQYWEDWLKRQKSHSVIEKVIQGEFIWEE
ncbi:GIY-YIG nuclease superfamily protein [bacterium BMS3Bbin03]|nr:GIY-YIG nuclease superfamily protein [bacterium BMS3Bbin03]